MKGKLSKELAVKLLMKAKEAKAFSYAPYSHFHVGAAVLTQDNEVFSGCNVENASYGLTICAERTALFNAISKGHHKIKAVAINCDSTAICSPCGACRQVLYEFAKDALIVMGSERKYKVASLSKLLPLGFSFSGS